MRQQPLSQVTSPYATITLRSRQYPKTRAIDDTRAIRYAITVCLVTMAMLISTASFAAESHRYCNPEVSKPCGKGCVLLSKACHIPWTTSISGIKPRGAQASTTPVYVETAPTASK